MGRCQERHPSHLRHRLTRQPGEVPHEINKLWPTGVLAATALTAAAFIGCSTSQPPIPLDDSKHTVLLMGLLPNWDLEEMVRSAAPMLSPSESCKKTWAARLSPAESTTRQPTTKVFTTYKVDVERAFYPSTLPEHIAVLAETGVAPGNDNIIVAGFEGVRRL